MQEKNYYATKLFIFYINKRDKILQFATFRVTGLVFKKFLIFKLLKVQSILFTKQRFSLFK